MEDGVVKDVGNIDDRKGNIRWHMLMLSKEQIEKIEDIILSEKVKVAENYLYEVE